MLYDLDCLKAVFPKSAIFENEPMKNHTSFKTGGTADMLFVPDSVEMLKQAVGICVSRGISYYVIGNGSNLLVRDGGFRGVIIKIGKNLSDIHCSDSDNPGYAAVAAQAGVFLSDLSKFACTQSLTGFEFASGIPGTLGGAVCMNAGAYSGEIKDILISAEIMNEAGEISVLSNAQMEFGYRKSAVQNTSNIILTASILLKKGNADEINAKVNELTETRKQKQPLENPSAGSTFKRPEGHFTGKLITDAGLKGFSLGGAKVSEKHAGFVVNYNNATSKDIIELIEHVIETVRQKFDVTLEPEVKIIGDDKKSV